MFKLTNNFTFSSFRNETSIDSDCYAFEINLSTSNLGQLVMDYNYNGIPIRLQIKEGNNCWISSNCSQISSTKNKLRGFIMMNYNSSKKYEYILIGG